MDMSQQEVESTILGWQASRLTPIRLGAKGLGFILRACWSRSCPDIVEAIGHPGHHIGAKVNNQIEPLVRHAEILLNPVEDIGGPWEITTSVLVIGSGCGASAFVDSFLRNAPSTWPNLLAPSKNREADLLIVEKGPSIVPHAGGQRQPESDHEAMDNMMENRMILSSNDGSLSLIAGSTWGGGGRVNWSACLQTDKIVRDEWTKHIMDDKGVQGDPHGNLFSSAEWQDCMDV